MPQVYTVILGGGRGQRLYPLTKHRAKPAVPVGGKYRLIDIPLSNAINSGFRHIAVLTQFNSASLNSHITNTYRFDIFGQGQVEVLAAEQSDEGGDWFQGTAYVLSLLCLLDATLVPFLPWLDSGFAEKTGGYPTRAVFLLCVYSKIGQSLLVLVCQVVYIKHVLEVAATLPAGASPGQRPGAAVALASLLQSQARQPGPASQPATPVNQPASCQPFNGSLQATVDSNQQATTITRRITKAD
jgi:hypothetical protein